MRPPLVTNFRTALNAAEEVEVRGANKVLKKTGLNVHTSNATGGDASLEEERKNFTKEGEKVPGFASSVVPTMEEKMVEEHRPPRERMAHPDENGDATHQNGDAQSAEEARADGELYGAPANGDVQHDRRPPRQSDAKSDIKKDLSEEEEKAPDARSTLRKNLTVKLGTTKSGKAGQWTMPTPTPHVDPYGFEDPLCDEFWKDMWVSCAVHNVSYLCWQWRI